MFSLRTCTSAFLLIITVGHFAGAQITESDLKTHAEALRQRLPAGFTVIVQSPFVVIGDDAPQQLRRFAVGTVQWAVDHLKADFFAHDPGEIIDIYLFKDAHSYNRHTREIFHTRPHT